MKKLYLFLLMLVLLLMGVGCDLNSVSYGRKFVFNEFDDFYTLLGYSGKSENVVVPSEYKGKPVISIGKLAFLNKDTIKTIKLPDTIEIICEAAFFGCKNLESIYIPKNVNKIESFIFAECASLVSVEVDKENKVYDSRNNCNAIIETKTNTLINGCNTTLIPEGVKKIGSNAFPGLPNLKELYIPSSVIEIDEKAIQANDNLERIIVDKKNKVYDSSDNCNGIVITKSRCLFIACKNTKITEKIISFSEYCFCNCNQMKEFHLPSKIEQIGRIIMQDGSNLEKITVSENNKNYHGTKRNDAIISNYGQLILGCNNTIIPEGVNTLNYGAFYGSGIKELVIPNTVYTIEENVFFHNDNLTKLYIPKSVKHIGMNFTLCPNLTIYTEYEEMPEGWMEQTFSDVKVVWGYKENK